MGLVTCTGLNSDVQGAAVAVTECAAPSGRSSATQDAVVCEFDASPPACMQGAAAPPSITE